ncbi:MAG: NYN domain-containing protein [Clostridiales bacterium]|nr:NYN domain-containing protein [Clostridiales bacterium]
MARRLRNIDKRIAVLIDADNVSSKYIKAILDELSKNGVPTLKRIYSDWTRPEMAAWKNVLLTYSITPVQQYSYTSGKNATDSSLIIDAMDILYTGHVDSFCIVSSDSDFTRLAARLREAGMHVIGMGEKKTPQSFISACEVFKYLEVLDSIEVLVSGGTLGTGASPAAEGDNVEERAAGKEAPVSGTLVEYTNNVSSKEEIIRTIKKIVADTSEEDGDGWAFLGMVGSVLNKQKPDFDSRNYGYQKLTQFVKSLGVFEIEHRPTNNPGIKHTYIRIKTSPKTPRRKRLPAPVKKAKQEQFPESSSQSSSQSSSRSD